MNFLHLTQCSFSFAELHWERGYQTGLLWTVLIILASLFIWRLLKQEQQLVSRPVGLSLLGLRSLILLLLLVTFWKPTLIRSYERDRTSKLLIAMDVSESMQLKDRHASPEEKLRWARAMNWVTPETELIVEPIEKSEPKNEEAPPQEIQQEVQDENLTALFEQLSTLTRNEIVTRSLQQQDVAFRKSLEEKHLLEYLKFAGETEIDEESDDPNGENKEELDPSISEELAPTEVLSLTETDLIPVQQKAIQLSGSQPVAGIILFTDGQHNQPIDPLQLASSLKQLEIPVYPVIVGSEQRPADIILQEVAAPPAVYLNDESSVTVNIETIELPEEEITIEFYHQGELIEQQSFVTSAVAHSSETISFPLQTDIAEQHHYEIKVLAHQDEFTTENNQQHFTQQVLDNTINALLIDSHPRWEFRFLHNALERDERISLQTVLLNPPLLSTDQQKPEPPFATQLQLRPEYQDSIFEGVDLIILGDITSSQLNETGPPNTSIIFWKQLEQFVSEEGKTLVLLPGSQLIKAWDQETIASQLAPVIDPRRIQPLESTADPLPMGMPVLPTVIGYGISFLQFADQPDLNQQVWQRLPGHFSVFTGSPKPAAEIVLEAFPDPNKPGQPAMLYQQYGQGQVGWMGIDSTWRWRKRVGDQFHHRFWGQVARWAIQNKLSVETDLVRFGPERAEGTPNQAIRLHAHFSSILLDRLSELNPQVVVYKLPHTRDEKPIARLPLLPLPSRQQSMTAVVENLTEGEYEFLLETTDDDVFAEEIMAPYVVRPVPSREQTETIANRELLAELANLTGGKLLELDQLGQIPDIIQTRSSSETWREQTEIWTHPLWLALFVLLLSLEWLLRKWHGLP
ncbi:hypothetical protein Pla110_13180 [Polystyrenella longa]|uniref:VWFA domain-containing protein n=1 Tax=Polystyrenella longa TaxID=2528007 RepID=A0A518CK65_9PLAN|nr:VWA domain-containing protein [Polystyrenella longa]QDU79607.1 hypothetical protein Pla110_13180 [Polystyrenella longa]